MDLLLQQPVEAVAFRAYFLPEVAGAAAWTCLATVLAAAAAAGLWRLRCSTPHAAKPLGLEHRLETKIRETETETSASPEPTSSSAPKIREMETETSASPEPTSSSAPAPAPVTARERYTAYYHYDGGCVGCCGVEGEGEDSDDDDEDHHHGQEEDLEDDEDVVYGTPSSETDPFDWQQVVIFLPLEATPRASETGRCRSPGTIGGTSVVRLWDQGTEGGLTAPAASPRRRMGVVVAGDGIGTVSLF